MYLRARLGEGHDDWAMLRLVPRGMIRPSTRAEWREAIYAMLTISFIIVTALCIVAKSL